MFSLHSHLTHSENRPATHFAGHLYPFHFPLLYSKEKQESIDKDHCAQIDSNFFLVITAASYKIQLRKISIRDLHYNLKINLWNLRIAFCKSSILIFLIIANMLSAEAVPLNKYHESKTSIRNLHIFLFLYYTDCELIFSEDDFGSNSFKNGHKFV